MALRNATSVSETDSDMPCLIAPGEVIRLAGDHKVLAKEGFRKKIPNQFIMIISRNANIRRGRSNHLGRRRRRRCRQRNILATTHECTTRIAKIWKGTVMAGKVEHGAPPHPMPLNPPMMQARGSRSWGWWAPPLQGHAPPAEERRSGRIANRPQVLLNG